MLSSVANSLMFTFYHVGLAQYTYDVNAQGKWHLSWLPVSFLLHVKYTIVSYVPQTMSCDFDQSRLHALFRVYNVVYLSASKISFRWFF